MLRESTRPLSDDERARLVAERAQLLRRMELQQAAAMRAARGARWAMVPLVGIFLASTIYNLALGHWKAMAAAGLGTVLFAGLLLWLWRAGTRPGTGDRRELERIDSDLSHVVRIHEIEAQAAATVSLDTSDVFADVLEVAPGRLLYVRRVTSRGKGLSQKLVIEQLGSGRVLRVSGSDARLEPQHRFLVGDPAVLTDRLPSELAAYDCTFDALRS